MKPSPFLSILVVALLAITAAPQAYACRPFGSYDFVEDEQGSVWFTEQDNNAISRLAKDGSVTAYPIPTPNAEPNSLTLDGNGNLWFSEIRAGKVGRVAPDGTVSEYALPYEDARPHSVLSQAGAIWITTGPLRRTVIRMDMKGKFTEISVPYGWPSSIAADTAADGALWVTLLQPGETMDQAEGYLARLNRSGEWAIVERRGTGSCPSNVHIDNDGVLWLSDRCRGTIERRDVQGRTASFPYEGIVQKAALDNDGNFWFADNTHRNFVGRMSPDGILDTWPLPGNNGGPFTVAVLSNGDVLFSEMYNYNINRLTRGGVFEEYLVSVDHRERVRTANKGEVCRLEYAAAIADKMALEQKRLKVLKTAGFNVAPGQELVRGRCLMCHDATRILRARKSDWRYTIELMQAHMAMRGLPPLTDEERWTVIGYLNRYYNTTN